MELYNFFTEQVSDKKILEELMPELNEVCHFVHIVEWPIEGSSEIKRYSIIGQLYGSDTNVGDVTLLCILTGSGISYTWFDAFLPQDNNITK